MSIIREAKCGRCDRRYSGLRSRCPYCGARRSKKGKYANNTEDSKGRLIIATLIVLVLVVAVAVLLISSISNNNGPEAAAPPTGDVSPSVGLPGESSNVTVSNPVSPPSPDISDLPPDEIPVTTVQSVEIRYSGVKTSDFSMNIGDVIPLTLKIVPENTTMTPVWEGDNYVAFSVVGDGTSGKVTALGTGTGTITVTVGEVTATCIVRVS